MTRRTARDARRDDGDAPAAETVRVATDGAGAVGARESAGATDGVDEPGDAGDESGVTDHPVALAVGVGAVLVGVGAAVGVDVVPPPPERPAAILLGAVLVLAGAALGVRRVRTPVEQADPPVVESRGEVAVPGASFDADLDAAVSGEFGGRQAARSAVAKRLRETAASVLAVTQRVPLDRASERVAGGDWPPDAAIDAVLDEGRMTATTARVRRLLGLRTPVERRADRVLAALADAMPGLDPGEWTTSRTLLAALRSGPRTSAGRRDESDDGETGSDERPPVEGKRRDTRRWTGVAAAATAAVGVGVFATLESGTPSLVVAAGAAVGAAGYAALASPPAVSLAVERRVDADRPEPGDEVEVTVTVENTGENRLWDLRVVDGVPPGLQVVEGSPRYATALGSGESVRFSYVVETTRGGHDFEPLRAIARDPSGATERERRVAAEASTRLECVPDLAATADVPVFAQTARRTGRVDTDVAGEGIEFHSLREYRQGDPLSRVDWNRVAAAGEFATLQFHEERAATVVVVVDARRPAYVTADPDGPAVPDLQLRAADRLAASLLDAGDSVGLAAFSPSWCWLEPRGGDTQRARIQRHLATHEAFGPDRPTEPYYGRPPLRRLRSELPGHAQLLVLSPLADDRAVDLLREFHARGYPVTVVSPDPTGDRSPGHRLAAVERAVRLSRLRRSGVRVVDWDTDDPLPTTLESAAGRWSG